MDGGTTGTRKVFLFFFFFSSKRRGEWKQERQFLSLYRYTFLRKGYVIGNWMQNGISNRAGMLARRNGFYKYLVALGFIFSLEFFYEFGITFT